MAVVNPDLGLPDDDGLKRLADDLDEMQRHLEGQVRRMDGVVDRIQARWQGPAGTVYRDLHKGAAQDAVRIRENIRVLAEAVRLSRDGFTEQELDVLASMRRVQRSTDVAREAEALQAPEAAPEPGPRSALNDL